MLLCILDITVSQLHNATTMNVCREMKVSIKLTSWLGIEINNITTIKIHIYPFNATTPMDIQLPYLHLLYNYQFEPSEVHQTETKVGGTVQAIFSFGSRRPHKT